MTISKSCDICTKSFTLAKEDIDAYNKFGLEPQDLCSQCMHMRRLCFRNERVFYKRNCDATGENILAIYHPQSPYKVYKADYFWSDKWNPLDYGQDFDFNRPFFEQFAELKIKVPRLAIHNAKSENSEYCNTCVGNKNSYLIFGGDYNEDCMFGVLCDNNKCCTDIDYCYRCELLYFCSDDVECYGSGFLFNSTHCSDCWFCDECVGCNECILSFNLKNQSYCIENKKYPKEEYFERKKQLITGKRGDFKNLAEKFMATRDKKISRFAHVINCQNCTGDYLKNSKNCTNCFDVTDSEDCREVIYGSEIKDCFQCGLLGLGSAVCFNTISTVRAYNTICSFWTVDDSNLAYCDFCINSSDLFGCVCLNHQKFCILNKQYSEAKYKELREKIIQHMKKTTAEAGQAREWGQFFPAKLSCFGYNETTANLYYPLSKEEAIKRGFNWRDSEEKTHMPQTYEIPDDIKDVKDEILAQTLECISCHQNFRIVKQELDWLKRQKVPILRVCPECRLKKRANMRNPRSLWERNCAKCGTEIETTYAPEKPETVYCEKCYLSTIY